MSADPYCQCSVRHTLPVAGAGAPLPGPSQASLGSPPESAPVALGEAFDIQARRRERGQPLTPVTVTLAAWGEVVERGWAQPSWSGVNIGSRYGRFEIRRERDVRFDP